MYKYLATPVCVLRDVFRFYINLMSWGLFNEDDLRWSSREGKFMKKKYDRYGPYITTELRISEMGVAFLFWGGGCEVSCCSISSLFGVVMCELLIICLFFFSFFRHGYISWFQLFSLNMPFIIFAPVNL